MSFDFRTLNQYTAKLRELPVTLAQKVAEASAPVITEMSRETFEQSEDAYGAPWAPGAKGQKVTLVKTGALERFLVYTAIGTKLRAVLGVPYAKFQIGKRPVFPVGALPKPYVEELSRVTAETINAELGR